MTWILDQMQKGLRREKSALLSAILGLGLLLTCAFPPTRTLSEEEIETPNCACIIRSHCMQRSTLPRIPKPFIVRAQGRAIDRGSQTRHGNNEQSKKNGSGSYLII